MSPAADLALVADARGIQARMAPEVPAELQRVLVVHNRYQHAGGEDSVVHAELALLRAMGHDVEVLEEDNDGIVQWNGAAMAAFDSVYSARSARRVRAMVEKFKPAVMHVHNFFSAHLTLRTLCRARNGRAGCANSAQLQAAVSIVHVSAGRQEVRSLSGQDNRMAAIQHACYRKSHAASAAVAGMLAVHRMLGTWERTVSRFIAPSEFARRKFIEGGLPAERIAVKPHFVNPDPGMGYHAGNYALFVAGSRKKRAFIRCWTHGDGCRRQFH